MSRKSLALGVFLGAALLVSTWPVAAQSNGPYQYHPVTPCRVVDTRNVGEFPGAYGPGLVSREERMFPFQGNCLVPSGAKAVTVNVTVAKPTAQAVLNAGYLTIWPSGVTKPLVATINWAKGTTALANGAIVPLADNTTYPKDLTVSPFISGGGKVEVILDVTGYFQ